MTQSLSPNYSTKYQYKLENHNKNNNFDKKTCLYEKN